MFVPFAGCPNRCSFCDQHSITGVCQKTTPEDVRLSVEKALSSGGIDSKNSEIAFFGGSFTAVDREYMLCLLEAANPYLKDFAGIRISTRPDNIDRDVLLLLKEYGVSAIELGAQSMNDDVLSLNDRGHNSDSVRNASVLIKEYGFSLGLQMMTGLYGSSRDIDLQTAREFIALGPDTVRIYPTVILKNTKLEKLYISGAYVPDTLDETVNICSELISLFEENNIAVIRVGLHSSETVEGAMLAGGYHPALRELCENRIFYNIIKEKLAADNIPAGRIIISSPPSAVSKITGQKRTNLAQLKAEGYIAKVVTDATLTGRQIMIQEG